MIFQSMAAPAYLPESAVIAPCEMIAVTEIDTSVDDDGDGDPHPEMVYTLVLSGRWHGHQCNALLCDGHIQHLCVSSWLDRRQWWNYNHQEN